jgi:hypothetical protein
MCTVADLTKRLNEQYKPDQHIAIAIWCEEDVIGRAEERGIKVTQEQAQRILDTIENKQDCEIGISWVELDIYTDAELEEAQAKTD